LYTNIKEAYSNSKNFSSGHIYRQIRLGQLHGREKEVGKWQARLSKGLCRDIARLHKMAEECPATSKFRDKLDLLLQFPGLWEDFHVGNLRRLLYLRCPEELVRYVTLIYDTFNGIFGESNSQYLDTESVRLIQGRCFALSSTDLKFVEDKFASGKLFSRAKQPDLRQRVWNRLTGTSHRIPSFHTLLEDTKLIEPCAKILRQLLPKEFGTSIESAFRKRYIGGQLLIDSDSSAVPYRKLWMFAIRHFPEMTGVQPRKDDECESAAIQGSVPHLQRELACFAHDLGFQSDQISRLGSSTPNVRAATDLIHYCQPSVDYDLTLQEEDFETSVREICQILNRFENKTGVRNEGERPALSRKSRKVLQLQERCGKPFEQAFRKLRRSLYYRWVYEDSWRFLDKRWQAIHRLQSATPFAIARFIFLAFFGTHSSMHQAVVNESVVPPEGADDVSAGIGVIWDQRSGNIECEMDPGQIANSEESFHLSISSGLKRRSTFPSPSVYSEGQNSSDADEPETKRIRRFHSPEDANLETAVGSPSQRIKQHCQKEGPKPFLLFNCDDSVFTTLENVSQLLGYLIKISDRMFLVPLGHDWVYTTAKEISRYWEDPTQFPEAFAYYHHKNSICTACVDL
jgi:hypothetical protein